MWPFKNRNTIPKSFPVDSRPFTDYKIGANITGTHNLSKETVKMSIIDIIDCDIMILRVHSSPNSFITTLRRELK